MGYLLTSERHNDRNKKDHEQQPEQLDKLQRTERRALQGPHPPPTTSQRYSEHRVGRDDPCHRCLVLRYFSYSLCITFPLTFLRI